MDAKRQELEDRLAEILKHSAHVASPIQQDGIGQVSAAHATETMCPECRNKCPVDSKARQVTSVDGPVEPMETVASCGRCRRSFFPNEPLWGLTRENQYRASRDSLLC